MLKKHKIQINTILSVYTVAEFGQNTKTFILLSGSVLGKEKKQCSFESAKPDLYFFYSIIMQTHSCIYWDIYPSQFSVCPCIMDTNTYHQTLAGVVLLTYRYNDYGFVFLSFG